MEQVVEPLLSFYWWLFYLSIWSVSCLLTNLKDKQLVSTFFHIVAFGLRYLDIHSMVLDLSFGKLLANQDIAMSDRHIFYRLSMSLFPLFLRTALFNKTDN
jgi:hypothetical protein